MKNFTRSGALLAAALLVAATGRAQTINTVGIIGPGAPSGAWDVSNGVNALTRSTSNTHVWTATLTMSTGDFKFRANDDWTINWGASTFPSGTGTQNGPNIPATAGRYNITFNDQTGVYNFTTATATREASTAALRLSLTPNPTSVATSIAYELPTAATVTLAVHNALGQVVRQLPAVRQGAGPQEQQIPQLGLAPGIYLVQLQADDQRQAVRLLVE